MTPTPHRRFALPARLAARFAPRSFRRAATLAALTAGAVALSGCAGWKEHVYRVHTVSSLAVARDATGMTIRSTGYAAGDSWGKVSIRRIHEPTFPPGVLTYELVAVGDFRINPDPPSRWQRVSATLRVPPPPPGTHLVNIIGGVNDQTLFLPRVGRRNAVGRPVAR